MESDLLLLTSEENMLVADAIMLLQEKLGSLDIEIKVGPSTFFSPENFVPYRIVTINGKRIKMTMGVEP